MELVPMPSEAAWNHEGIRRGFEVLFARSDAGRTRLRGQTTAREGSSMWAISYDIQVGDRWRTETAEVTALTHDGLIRTTLERSDGRWTVDGAPRPDLDGCLDIDCESSAVTNTLPIHRIDFEVGTSVEVPAAFVRADDLRVERLEQRYTLTAVTDAALTFHYESPTFDFACDLVFDRAGLITSYPGIATRDS